MRCRTCLFDALGLERKNKLGPARTPAVFFCGCVALSTFVRYDRRVLKHGFQQRPIFYETPVFYQDLFKFLYRRVVCSDKSSLSAVFCFCCCRADCLESKVSSDRDFSIYFFGYSHTCFVVASHYQSTSDYRFALTSMSFRDLPLL